LVEAPLTPSARGGVVVRQAAAVFAVVVQTVVFGDVASAVGDVGYARLAVDYPDLLTRRGDLGADMCRWVANEQTEGVPRAINSPPVLVGCNNDGRRYGGYAGQQSVARRAGGVLLGVFGGETWREQRAEEDGVYRRKAGATSGGRSHYGRW
jgi:hypothetical protein